MIEGATRRSTSVTRRLDSSSLKIARSRNSRQMYRAPMMAAAACASSRRMAAIASASWTACPQSAGHRGDRQLTTGLAQQDQGTGALKLDVVGMCVQGQNLYRRRHGFSP